MRNVMWKGELGPRINLDTISDKNGLYGLGPVSYLSGELLINDGQSYVSKVTSDSTMTVEETFKTSAPFFVYGNVTEWNEIDLPVDIKTIPDLEGFIDNKTTDVKRPFAFKLTGQVSSAVIPFKICPQEQRCRPLMKRIKDKPITISKRKMLKSLDFSRLSTKAFLRITTHFYICT